MSKLIFKNRLKSTDEYSEQKLSEFLSKMSDFPYFYQDSLDYRLQIDMFLQDQEVDFCLIEYQIHFDQISSEIFGIDCARIQNELNQKLFYDEILRQILEKEENLLETHKILGKKPAKHLTINKPALLRINLTNDEYLQILNANSDIILTELKLTSEEFTKIVPKPFALLFDITIGFEGEQTIKIPFLMVMYVEFLGINPVIKWRSIK